MHHIFVNRRGYRLENYSRIETGNLARLSNVIVFVLLVDRTVPRDCDIRLHVNKNYSVFSTTVKPYRLGHMKQF